MSRARRDTSVLAFVLVFFTSIFSRADECPVHQLRPPTGKYQVGTINLPVETPKGFKTSRQVQLWYPAAASSGKANASYVPSPEILGALRAQKFLNQPACVFDFWGTMKLPARVNAPFARITSRVPVVMVAPGAGVSRISYSYYAQQLASDGYLVATIDFGEGGFLVTTDGRQQQGPAVNREADYAAQAAEMARHMANLLDQFLQKPPAVKPELARRLIQRIDPARIAAIGHSLDGAAALDLCQADARVKGCVDLDGIPESPVTKKGLRMLMLRSQPDYSDADLAKLHRDRKQWNAMGEKIKAQLAKLLTDAGPDTWVVSIRGTGHLSFSDAPFTMPETILRYGGRILDPARALTMTVGIIEGYLQHAFNPAREFSIQSFPEASIQISKTSP